MLSTACFAAASLAAEPALLPVPHPDPARFEPSVRDALVEARDNFEERRASSTATGQAQAYGRLGKVYLAHQLTGAAERALANAAALAPKTFEWRYLLGFAREQQGDVEAAAADFEAALGLDAGYTAAGLRLGEARLAAGELAAARKAFENVLKREPRSAFALAGLGKVALQEKDYLAAIGWLEKALALDSRATGLYYPLAMAYRHTGDRDRARALMDRRGTSDPLIPDPLVASVNALSQSAQYYLQRGHAALGENRVADAVDDIRRAVKAAPRDLSARVSLAQALAAAGQLQEAMLQVNAALELDADYAPAHYRKGALLEMMGEEDAAVAQYRTAVELDRGYTNARLMLGYALMRRDDFNAAAGQFEELSTQQPGGVIVRYRLGLARLGAGDCEQAQPPLEEARQLDPRAGEILEALARAYATCISSSTQKRRAALDAARLLYEARPQPQQAATLAMALAANGRFDEAAELQSQVVETQRATIGADMLAALQDDLKRYRAGEPASRAWPAQAEVFDPPRLDPAADIAPE